MGTFLGIILGLFAIYLGLWLTIAGMFWLILPMMVVILPVAVAAGLVLGFVVAVLTLTGVRPSRPRTVTAADVEAGTAKLPKLRTVSAFGRDPAWPTYLAAQARVDLGTVARRILDVIGNGWQTINGLPDTVGVTWFWAFVLVFCYPMWAMVSLGALLAAALVVAAGGVLLLVLGACAVAGTGLLRGCDYLLRWHRGAASSCDYCYHVADVPAFPCHRCGVLHRDLRPGRLGVLLRRCRCGAPLRTTVARAARQLAATCPQCLEPLRAGAAVIRDIRLPVFGPVSAGKTRLVFAGLLALRERLGQVGGSLEFADATSSRTFTDGARIITDGDETHKTLPGRLPVAITAQVEVGKAKALLHVFDAAGESYDNQDDNSELSFLDTSQGLVFVVDPFSVRQVTDQLGGLGQVMLARANPAVDEPEHVYHVTVGRLRKYRVRTRQKALAIAVVKADLLAAVPLAYAPEPANVRDWLCAIGLDNLVLAAERDFAAVRYFLVASVAGTGDGGPMSADRPLRWLMNRAGLRMAEDETDRRQPATEGV